MNKREWDYWNCTVLIYLKCIWHNFFYGYSHIEMCNSRIQLSKWGEKVFPLIFGGRTSQFFAQNLSPGLGTRLRLWRQSTWLRCPFRAYFSQFFSQICSKWAEHTDSNLPTGSTKSTQCQRTNLTHWALTPGSEGNECVEIPGVYCVFVQLSPLGDPATQYRPLFLTGFLLLSAMFCCESCRLTSHKQVTWPFGRALPATLLKRKYRPLWSSESFLLLIKGLETEIKTIVSYTL